jgi:hypothetical protein
MKKIVQIALIGFLLAAAMVLLAQLTGLINLNKNSPKDVAKFSNSGVLELVCQFEVKRPVNGLSKPLEVSNEVMPAGVDFNDGTGWYPGEYAISINRKGTLKVNGALLDVSRSAMFSRYDFNIISEHFTLDRNNGEFRQWLELKGGKKLELITGTCLRSQKKAS